MTRAPALPPRVPSNDGHVPAAGSAETLSLVTRQGGRGRHDDGSFQRSCCVGIPTFGSRATSHRQAALVRYVDAFLSQCLADRLAGRRPDGAYRLAIR
jgi:hypothetical protein